MHYITLLVSQHPASLAAKLDGNNMLATRLNFIDPFIQAIGNVAR